MADEHFRQGWNHYMFRLLRAVFSTNPPLAREGGFILSWIADIYVEAALMLLRREFDKEAGTENLRNLLLDIAEHPEVLTRARYRSMCTQRPPGYDLADRSFDQFPLKKQANAADDHLDPGGVRRELDALTAKVERVRVYAERTRAHRTPEQSFDVKNLTYSDLHEAIQQVRDLVNRCHVLLTTACIAEWEPVPQYNTIAPFQRPWVQDPKAVRAGLADTRFSPSDAEK
jgi:hypothetical protein